MAYIKTNWINGETKINATNLNNAETGIENNDIAITGLKGTVLWTNSNINVEFVAQTVTLSESLNNYDMYEILFLQSITNERTMTSGKIPTGYGTILTWSTTNNFFRPTGTTVSGSSITFEDGKSGTGGGTPTIANENTIPYQVIGYKN